jgi:Protein of unknown function (DUF3631)
MSELPKNDPANEVYFAQLLADGYSVADITGEARIDLAEHLERTRSFFRRFVVVGDAEADAVALWVAHTYVFETARATPYLNFWSPEVGSGKTTALEVLETISRAGLTADDLSGAALFRLVESRRPTLLFDEVDAVFGKKNSDSTEDLRKILNSGYKAGKRVLRCERSGNAIELKEFDPYCPKATAGLHELPGTLAHRSIPISMKPPRADEMHEDFDPEEVEQETAAIRARFDLWAEAAEESLRDPLLKPSKLPELDARRNEIWRSLLRIADLAGERWPQSGRTAAVELSGGDRRNDEASLGIQLLGDIKQVFADERMACTELTAALNDLEDSRWGSWNDGGGIKTRELGRRLKPYGIRAKPIRIDGERKGNGYEREQFDDAFSRYLPQETGTTGTSDSQTQKTAVCEPVQASPVPVSEKPANPHGQTDVPVVPVEIRGNGGKGRNPLPGDDDFLEAIAAAHLAGHITTGEALDRERTHKLVMEARPG